MSPLVVAQRIVHNACLREGTYMVVYRLFIASSINEFRAERNKLVHFFSKLSRAAGEVEFVPFICEQASKALSRGRKQGDYNRKIWESDLFVLLAGSSVGQYTLEELNVALEAERQTKKPAIRCYYLEDLPPELADPARFPVVPTHVEDVYDLERDLLEQFSEELGIGEPETLDDDVFLNGTYLFSLG